MNTFPEVTWDRFTERPNGLMVYGWLDRADAYKDFMVILVDLVGRHFEIRFITSSARYSEEFSRRSGGTKHIACRRVQGAFDVRTVESQTPTAL